MTRVLIVDDSPVAVGNIQRLLGAQPDLQLTGAAATGREALAVAERTNPDIAVVDVDMEHGRGIDNLRLLAQTAKFPLLALGIDDTPATREAVTTAGAHEYLVKPCGAGEMLDALRRVAALRPANGTGATTTPPAQPTPAATAPPLMTPPPTTAPPLVAPHADVESVPDDESPAQPLVFDAPHLQPAPARAPQHPFDEQGSSSNNQVIAVISGKGGAGTTVIASSLALLAANEGGHRTALVDFDIQHGDVRRILRVDSPHNIDDLQTSGLTAQAIRNALTEAPAGVRALLAPVVPSPSAKVSPDFATALISALRDMAEITVVDLPTHVDDAVMTALSYADRIVLVSSMSDPGVRASQGMLRLLVSAGISPSKVVVALNRTEANSDIVKSAVEEALGRGVAVQLPYDAILVSTSVNRGAPFVLQKPDAQVSRRVRELAGLLFSIPTRQEVAEEEVVAPAAAYADEEPAGRRKKKGGVFSILKRD